MVQIDDAIRASRPSVTGGEAPVAPGKSIPKTMARQVVYIPLVREAKDGKPEQSTVVSATFYIPRRRGLALAARLLQFPFRIGWRVLTYPVVAARRYVHRMRNGSAGMASSSQHGSARFLERIDAPGGNRDRYRTAATSAWTAVADTGMGRQDDSTVWRRDLAKASAQRDGLIAVEELVTVSVHTPITLQIGAEDSASLGFALGLLSMICLPAPGRTVPHIAATGVISVNNKIEEVLGFPEKLNKICSLIESNNIPRDTLVLIPEDNQDKVTNYHKRILGTNLIPVDNLREAAEAVGIGHRVRPLPDDRWYRWGRIGAAAVVVASILGGMQYSSAISIDNAMMGLPTGDGRTKNVQAPFFSRGMTPEQSLIDPQPLCKDAGWDVAPFGPPGQSYGYMINATFTGGAVDEQLWRAASRFGVPGLGSFHTAYIRVKHRNISGLNEGVITVRRPDPAQGMVAPGENLFEYYFFAGAKDDFFSVYAVAQRWLPVDTEALEAGLKMAMKEGNLTAVERYLSRHFDDRWKQLAMFHTVEGEECP